MADLPAVAGVQGLDQVPDLNVRLHDLELLEVVPVLVDDRRAAVLHEAEHEVQVPAALRPFVEGVEAQEAPSDLLEAGLRAVEAEADAIARADVHPFQELLVAYARFLHDTTVLGAVVFRFCHGAVREG